MPRQRSTGTAAFELQAVRMVTDRKLAVAEVARRLDVGETLLRTWKRALEERGRDAFPRHGHPTPAADGLRRLRAENARLRAEPERKALIDTVPHPDREPHALRERGLQVEDAEEPGVGPGERVLLGLDRVPASRRLLGSGRSHRGSTLPCHRP